VFNLLDRLDIYQELILQNSHFILKNFLIFLDEKGLYYYNFSGFFRESV